MPYKPSEDPSNLPVDPMGSSRYPSWPLGPLKISISTLGPSRSPVLPYKLSEDPSNVAVDPLRPALDSTAVSIFVAILVVIVNSTNISTNIETAVLSTPDPPGLPRRPLWPLCLKYLWYIDLYYLHINGASFQLGCLIPRKDIKTSRNINFIFSAEIFVQLFFNTEPQHWWCFVLSITLHTWICFAWRGWAI